MAIHNNPPGWAPPREIIHSCLLRRCWTDARKVCLGVGSGTTTHTCTVRLWVGPFGEVRGGKPLVTLSQWMATEGGAQYYTRPAPTGDRTLEFHPPRSLLGDLTESACSIFCPFLTRFLTFILTKIKISLNQIYIIDLMPILHVYLHKQWACVPSAKCPGILCPSPKWKLWFIALTSELEGLFLKTLHK